MHLIFAFSKSALWIRKFIKLFRGGSASEYWNMSTYINLDKQHLSRILIIHKTLRSFFLVLDMIQKNWIHILNQQLKLHWIIVSNVYKKFFGISKNASWTFLRTFFHAVFNSKHISSSKDFSKMFLKARNWPEMAFI